MPKSEPAPIKTATECTILGGQNLPNHSETMAGKGKYIRISGGHYLTPIPTIRTRQEAYRLAGHIIKKAEEVGLADEEGQPADGLKILTTILPTLSAEWYTDDAE